MITKENVTVYSCEHCRKKYFVKTACERHEPYCTMSPDNHVACTGCQHFEEYKKEIFQDHPYGGETSYFTKAFRCNAKGIGLYPIKVVARGLVDRYPETFDGEELMPKECDQYQYFI